MLVYWAEISNNNLQGMLFKPSTRLEIRDQMCYTLFYEQSIMQELK